ncbi:MFS transporter [Duganella sp. FT80W]|uniref:MFS transporter n=1 Tax=Duganella guangzhouensis TaxID=2666084 RepID=A0A6I2L0H7_9BURK|nr:MFS transporter [Duganella guangzhouensis]MRW89789.1 MFS transporter [Duganella guangzhouensis]
MNDHAPRRANRIALMIGHCAGMIDLVALPVWVGTLITRYGLAPQQAGLLATLFLGGAVCASLFWAPRFQRIAPERVAGWGFGIAGIAFAAMTQTSDYGAMAALHALAGLAAGSALSVTHGTIGSGEQPHRSFAMAGLALAVFGIFILGGTPVLVERAGGPALFKVFAAVMIVAALTSVAAFPRRQGATEQGQRSTAHIDSTVWYAAVGISCMGLVQAMMFSFVERIGADRGFGVAAVTGVLVALGIVNLAPAPLAALLERRWPARYVVLAGPVVQATLALIISHSSEFAPYAGATAAYAAVMIFTHTFAFGLIARLDPGGRALSATPAMLMIGAAIGPVLGGTLVQHAGYTSLGNATLAIATVAVCCFARAGRTRAVLSEA